MYMIFSVFGRRRVFSFTDRHDTKLNGKARPNCVIELQLMRSVIIFSRPKLNQMVSISLKTVT